MTDKRVVLLGNFDGVHLGHRALAEKGREYADKHGLKLILWSFDRLMPPYITSVEKRTELLEKYGVDGVVLCPFDEVKGLSGRQFVQQILKNTLNADTCVCGYNYSFGYGGKCGKSDLISLCSEYGINVIAVDEVRVGESTVSSSNIRVLLKSGCLEEANKLLGRPFAICGEIVKGAALGRTVGMPTANIAIEEGQCLIKNGVYATYAVIDGKKHPSVTNIGIRPTLNDGRGVIAECHILDFSEDIYGKYTELEFCSFLREEKSFPSLEAVKEAVQKDIAKAREKLKTEK